MLHLFDNLIDNYGLSLHDKNNLNKCIADVIFTKRPIPCSKIVPTNRKGIAVEDSGAGIVTDKEE